MGPNSVTGILVKGEVWRQTQTQEGIHVEDKGRDQSDVSTCQGMPKTSSTPPGAAERPGIDSSSQPVKKGLTTLTLQDQRTLISGLWSLNLRDNKFLWCKPPNLWYLDTAVLENYTWNSLFFSIFLLILSPTTSPCQCITVNETMLWNQTVFNPKLYCSPVMCPWLFSLPGFPHL